HGLSHVICGCDVSLLTAVLLLVCRFWYPVQYSLCRANGWLFPIVGVVCVARFFRLAGGAREDKDRGQTKTALAVLPFGSNQQQHCLRCVHVFPNTIRINQQQQFLQVCTFAYDVTTSSNFPHLSQIPCATLS
ncbi:unnamed protein product, partial [Ectocarpus sp. 8 AP-2014]